MQPDLQVTSVYDPTQHKHIRKLGSYLSLTDDLQQRISSVTIAFTRLTNIWHRSNLISTTNRLRLYNAYVYPLFIYNLGAVAYTKAQLHKLDTIHRRQLRRLLRIFYPNTIHNKMLYQRCRTAPMSVIHIETRWKLFGHILRLPPIAPPRQAMNQYFTEPCFTRNGRPPTTLPIRLKQDLSLLPPTHNRYRLKTLPHLNRLTNKAQNRQDWKSFTDTVVMAHKVESDQHRRRSEAARLVPTLRTLNTNYYHHDYMNYPTPAGMDFRNNQVNPHNLIARLSPRNVNVLRIRPRHLQME